MHFEIVTCWVCKCPDGELIETDEDIYCRNCLPKEKIVRCDGCDHKPTKDRPIYLFYFDAGNVWACNENCALLGLDKMMPIWLKEAEIIIEYDRTRSDHSGR